MEDGGSRSSRLLPAAAKYKSMSPARLPISRSPCLTIPPGISPTTLLDSPVLLTNVKVEPSPTTGTFTIPSVVNQIGQELVASPPRSSDSSSCEEGCSEEFEFRPRSRLGSGVSQPLGVLSYTRTELEGCAPKNFGEYSSCIYANSVFKPEPETVMLKNLTSSQVATYHEGDIKSVSSSEMISSKMQHIDDFTNSSHALQMDHKGPDLLNSTDKNCDDGYNWRKYGQKHVKGSEFPRSYYKCTHPNCQVKKQLERSHDGQITDIIYKGKHDHPKPQPSRKLAIGAVLAGQEEERNNGTSSSTGGDDKNSKVDDRKCHLNDTNRTPELSPIPEVSNFAGPAELSNNKYDDIADDDDDDPEAKRRRKENSSMDIAGMNKITREPRVVIQTLSEVDILDDGYRWRKYGQKVVKGNPNPRSYYKCTNLGCPVRKHVERASHDPKAVITTYEGKHNHDVPAARTTSHDTAAASMAINSSASIYDCVPAPVGYDGVRTAPQNFNQCDDSDSISLDLGVGLSPRQRDGNNHLPQNIALERARSMEIDSSSSGSSKLAMPSAPSAFYYGMPKNGTNYFGSTESPGEGFNSMVASASHPSDAYNVNIGNLLMRP